MTVHPPCRQRRRGFTLTEVSIAMVVISLGILSLLHAMASGTRINSSGRDLTQATFLAQEIREWTLRLPFVDPQDAANPPGPDGSSPQVFVDDLDDLMDVTYSPPRDGAGDVIDGLSVWSQTITLEWVDPADFSATVQAGDSDVIRVTASVRKQGVEVMRTSWLVFRRETE